MEISEALLVTILLGLGTARMSAIIAIDRISESLRDLIFHYFPPDDNDAMGFFYQGMRRANRDELARQSDWRASWWVRRFVTVGHGEHERNPTFIGNLVSCQKCLGVWIAAVDVVAYATIPTLTIWFNMFLAASLISAVANGRYYR